MNERPTSPTGDERDDARTQHDAAQHDAAQSDPHAPHDGTRYDGTHHDDIRNDAAQQDTARLPLDVDRAAYLARTEPPHADPTTLRPAYAFDGTGPYLYAADGSGPYAYAADGRGPYRLGSPALHGTVGTGAAGGGAGAGTHAGWTGAFGTAPGSDRKRRKTLLGIGAGVAALALLGGVGGTAFGLATQNTSRTTSSQQQGASPFSGNSSDGSQYGFTVPGEGSLGGGSSDGTQGGSQGGTGTDGSTGSGTGTQSAATAATSAQKKGVVTIDTIVGYDSGSRAAGTGMILTTNGYVLTNNHVVQGATSIVVTDETTGKEYKADVVGTDSTHDVAVLKLQDASGLSTVKLDDDGDPETGDTVTDVGNAEGTGNLVAAEGTVTALDQDITVQSESGSGTESLSGLIEVAADIVSGDSGGPVVDSEGEVVGMATAASSGSADVTGYAIPIATAKAIADDIVAGKASDTITIGLPAFLGVQVSGAATTSGVQVAGVVDGSPAETAGIATGDVITSIDGTAVTSADQLTELIRQHGVGDRVTVGITGTDGATSTVTATLTAGPAD